MTLNKMEMVMKWLDDRFANNLNNKMSLLILLWVLDKLVMIILFWLFK
jgi:hypothetical protein